MKRRDFVKVASASLFSLPFAACSTDKTIPADCSVGFRKIRGSFIDGVYRYPYSTRNRLSVRIDSGPPYASCLGRSEANQYRLSPDRG